LSNPIILASSSPFRRELLNRLNLEFSCNSPDIDETARIKETASDYVIRLAYEKALAVAKTAAPRSIIIGSDQCAVLDGNILGKPGNHANAMSQLKSMQGRSIIFHTGVCVLQTDTRSYECEEVLYEVKFRQLNDKQLDHYLRVEEPYQCAGSFKSEGYGIALFDAMSGTDPTAIIGLPLIRLVSMLENAGVTVI
jgi:septum formation protein